MYPRSGTDGRHHVIPRHGMEWTLWYEIVKRNQACMLYLRLIQGTMGLWDGMDKRDLACNPDMGLKGCPMGSQDTMELLDRIDKMN